MKKILPVMLLVLFTATSAFCGQFEDVLKMAEQGDAAAQSKLGEIYAKGIDVPQDHKKAAYWYKKAAEQGYADAQHNLGFMYAEGQGIPQNFKLAYVWSSLAAAQGKGINNRDVVAKMLTPEQLSEAQDLAATLQSQIETQTETTE
ncbi:MAG: tetratricopeptide repeat protein [Desulfotignum sp.]|nr:tetratricopeptide repeat protein [Desulfotignum sp.]